MQLHGQTLILQIKRGTGRCPVSVTRMLFPLALLYLTGHTGAFPTLVEFINSGLSIVGARYVPPPSSEPEQSENEGGTRQTSCRYCARKVNTTLYQPEFHLGRYCLFREDCLLTCFQQQPRPQIHHSHAVPKHPDAPNAEWKRRDGWLGE